MYRRVTAIFFLILLGFINCESTEYGGTVAAMNSDKTELNGGLDETIESVLSTTFTPEYTLDNNESTTQLESSDTTTEYVVHSSESITLEESSDTTTEYVVHSSESITPEESSDATIGEGTSTIPEDQVFDESTTKVTESTLNNEMTQLPFKLNDSSLTGDEEKPFYHKTVQQLVKVVETNLLEVAPTDQPEVSSSETVPTDKNQTEQRLSDQIRAIISHYQAYGEVSVPNANISDPMDIPDVKRNFGGTPTTFTTMKMYGMSNFTVSQINTDLNKMQVYVLVLVKRLVIIGNYSIKSFWVRKNGPFNVTLIDVEAEGAAELKRDENGTLQASDSTLDMSFRDAVVDFKNLGMVGSLLQGLLATAAPVLFDAIKPVVLKEINFSIRDDLNDKLLKIGNRLALAGSRPPLDAAVEEGRIYVKENGYDPYRIRDYTGRINVLTVNITDFVLEGLSRFQRVGEVVLAMDQGTIQIGPHIAVLDLFGRCKWAVGVNRNVRKEGYTNFTIDHVQVRALINQSLDVKTKPVLDSLDVNVGKVRVNVEGAGRFDIIVEIMINTLPELIRHIFIDAIEVPLRYKVQQMLNRIEPEIVLEKTLPELDNLGL